MAGGWQSALVEKVYSLIFSLIRGCKLTIYTQRMTFDRETATSIDYCHRPSAIVL